ncbi:Nickel transport complex protein, NikM subunit, transmembrane [Desulfovibrio sp. X2]|uniref:DUF4198 domain-containing protein n=1 Tax=Desulfovibrio sp. X2 TaxID=941449 RepID=UPI000358F352|nr:DUF4198 domain-containing protein [Desulfovibrio sp. X2]EPR37353.1 Nickel transport complex protein, NikM subunit, transmembrane [Desulfovibrio sp. X2]
MKRITCSIFAAALLLLSQAAWAHFGMIIPSEDVITQKSQADLGLTVAFCHPMERGGMAMEKPERFGVVDDGKITDLLPLLQETTVYGKKAWKASYAVKRPGVYTFFAVPKPYWEPAENCFIQHLTKVVVPAFGEEGGWDKPIGLKAEIVPLTRPFGNYVGNVFRGQVLVDGKPAPGVDVEIEYDNRAGKYAAPNEYMTTQVVKTDSQGVFAYSAPWPGWWGFAALTTSSETIKHDGQDKEVELGAVLWTRFVEPKAQKK